MGGINCVNGRPKSCHIAEEVVDSLRLEYASVVKNIFQINAYFSLANAHVEEIMSLENTTQRDLAFTKYEDVKQDLLTSLNASVALDNNLSDFFKNLDKVQSEVELRNDEALILQEMSLTNTKLTNLVNDLYNAYEVMPFESLVADAKVHSYLRHGDITNLTEKIVGLLSDELIFLQKYSVATKEIELAHS